MKALNLPDDILASKAEIKHDIIIHDYAAKMDTFKGRSVLNKNAVSLVLKGQKTMHFAEKTVDANDKEIHFLSAGNCIASIDLSMQEEFHSILIFFTNKVLTDFYIKNDYIIRQLKTTRSAQFQPYISFRKDDFIYNYISSLLLLQKSSAQLSQQMKLLKFEELMLYLLEKHPQTILSFQASQMKSQGEIAIRTAVETNITANLTIEELAFLCNLSPSTFKRSFAKIYGTSPSNWFLEQRMKMAASLLRQHKERPSEVFHKLGYENHSSFTKSFKKYFGVSPKEFQSEFLTV